MSHPGRLRHRVGAEIASRGLWQPGARVAIAVSGGCDSMALWSVLRMLTGMHEAELSVVTVDHGTREGSAADADFVQRQAEMWNTPCTRVALALGASATEAQMRQHRYRVFEDLDVEYVATAHHADDQAETVLMHAIRGTGSVGLAGMSWKRGRFVRPLLAERRVTLARWNEAYGVDYREDPSNRDLRFLRNRIRHRVLPLLEEVRPGSAAGLARTCSHAAADDALLSHVLHEATTELGDGPLPLAWVREQPRALVRRAFLRRWPSLTASRIDMLLQAVEAGFGRVKSESGAVIEVGPDGVRAAAVSPPG